jgi:hypothetical protein
VLEQCDRRHDHAGGAETALQTMMLPKGVLHWMQPVDRANSLDRSYLATSDLHGQNRAGLDGVAVQQHGAGATIGRVAAHMSAGEAESLADEVDQEQTRLDVGLDVSAVDGKRNVHPAILSTPMSYVVTLLLLALVAGTILLIGIMVGLVNLPL